MLFILTFIKRNWKNVAPCSLCTVLKFPTPSKNKIQFLKLRGSQERLWEILQIPRLLCKSVFFETLHFVLSSYQSHCLKKTETNLLYIFIIPRPGPVFCSLMGSEISSLYRVNRVQLSSNFF